MYSKLFEHLYSKYHLQEMGNYFPKNVKNRFYVALQNAQRRVADFYAIKDRTKVNTNHLRDGENEKQHLKKAVEETIDAGKGQDRHSSTYPFRMILKKKIIVNHTNHPELAEKFVRDLETIGKAELKEDFINSIEGWICKLLLFLPKDSKDQFGLYKCCGFSLKSIFEMWKDCYDRLLG